MSEQPAAEAPTRIPRKSGRSTKRSSQAPVRRQPVRGAASAKTSNVPEERTRTSPDPDDQGPQSTSQPEPLETQLGLTQMESTLAESQTQPTQEASQPETLPTQPEGFVRVTRENEAGPSTRPDGWNEFPASVTASRLRFGDAPRIPTNNNSPFLAEGVLEMMQPEQEDAPLETRNHDNRTPRGREKSPRTVPLGVSVTKSPVKDRTADAGKEKSPTKGKTPAKATANNKNDNDLEPEASIRKGKEKEKDNDTSGQGDAGATQEPTRDVPLGAHSVRVPIAVATDAEASARKRTTSVKSRDV